MSETATQEKLDIGTLRAGGNSVQTVAGTYDVDVDTVLSRRDEALVADEIKFGAISGKFTYSINSANGKIEGISVIGARQLAFEYGGIEQQIVGSVWKRGSQFRSTSHPSKDRPYSVMVASYPEMETEPDFYTVCVKVTDHVKKNSVMIEHTELRWELKKDGITMFERKHIEAIAIAKAFRKGILSLVSQAVLVAFQTASLNNKLTTIDMTESLIDQKRDNITSFCIRYGISIDRAKLGQLAMAQITGLSESAKEGDAGKFTRALIVLGVSKGKITDVPERQPEKKEAAKPDAEKKPEAQVVEDKKTDPPADDKKPEPTSTGPEQGDPRFADSAPPEDVEMSLE